MRIDYTRQFLKQFRRLHPKVQHQFFARLDWFRANPYDIRLHNHALKGSYEGYRSINITGDVRALYREVDDTLVLYELIGTHSQLYE